MELPYFWLSAEDNIILSGRIDWLEYLSDTDSVHIIDFKTGRSQENKHSLQLPIYLLLASSTQSRPVSQASYWYIDSDLEPQPQSLPQIEPATKQILTIAKQIKLARQLKRFICPHSGCRYCQPLEAVLAGQAQLVGTDNINREIYVLSSSESDLPQSAIL